MYALGAVLYEVLSGQSPYIGRSALAVLEQVRRVTQEQRCHSEMCKGEDTRVAATAHSPDALL